MPTLELTLNRSLTTTDPDQALLRRLAQGDEDALRALLAAYGQRLYAYALRITGEEGLAEEVVQDTLVAAWQGAGRFRGEGRVIAWLLSIVHHKGLNAVKARHAERSQALPEDEAEGEALALPATEPAPDEQAALAEQRRLLRQGLQSLSLEHRTALELIFYQGLSLGEAAEVCGCPVGTIKSRLAYAKHSLRGILSREGWGAEAAE